MMMPNIGLSGSASSGADAASGMGDFIVTGGGSGVGGGKSGSLLWLALALVIGLGLVLYFRRRGNGK